MSKIKWTDDKIAFIQALYEDNTLEEIASRFKKKFKEEITPNAVRKSYYRNALPSANFSKQPKMPKILALDIETSPVEVYAWSLRQDFTPLNMLKREWSVIAWCAKFLDEDIIHYEDLRNEKNILNDKKILKKIHKLLDESDIVLSQNGVSFDIKKLNARFAMHGMKPPSSFRHIDTLKLARKHFKFTSNKLEWMTNTLCTDKKKLSHSKFPGFQLWKECEKGNIEAWNEMKEYNIADVESLIELYYILAAWDSSLNFSVYNDENTPTCSCGNQTFKKSGFYYTNASKFQKYKCDKCGREMRDKVNLLNKKK
jgi:hypothetical protein